MKSTIRCLVAFAIALTGAGCAQNAALEVELTLPPGPTDGTTMFAVVQARDAAEFVLEEEWRGGDLEPIALIPGEAIEDHVSILSTDASTDLLIKVRFCTSPDCIDIDDATSPDRWFEIEHPFYIGKRTYWTAEDAIPEIPTERDTAPLFVGRCEVEGCITGPIVDYCSLDGRHLCED